MGFDFNYLKPNATPAPTPLGRFAPPASFDFLKPPDELAPQRSVVTMPPPEPDQALAAATRGGGFLGLGSRASNPIDMSNPLMDPGMYDESSGGLFAALSRVPVLGGALTGAGQLVTAIPGLAAKASGSPASTAAFNENYKTNEGGTPGPFDVPAEVRGLAAAEQARTGELAGIAGDQSGSLGDRAKAALGAGIYGALPFVLPVPGAEAVGSLGGLRGLLRRGGGTEARAAEGSLALPVAREPLALPAPRADTPRPMPGAIAQPSPRGQWWNAPDKAPPIEGEFRELPVEEAPPAAAPAEPTAPQTLVPGRKYTFDELVKNAGAAPDRPLFNPNPEPPMGIEAKVRAGLDLTKLPERAASDAADAAAGRVPTGGDVSIARPSAAPSTLEEQLAASLRAKGRPDLVVSPDSLEGQLSASITKQQAKHDANEAVIAAYRDALESGDTTELERAVQKVVDAGGNLDHTRQRLRQAGLPGVPTAGEFKAIKAKGDTNAPASTSADVPPGRGGLLDRLARGNRDEGGAARLDLGLTGSNGLLAQLKAFVRDQGGEGRLDLGLSGKTTAEQKQILADRMGVDATTGRPLGGKSVDTASGGPPTNRTSRPPLTMASFARGAGRAVSEGVGLLKTGNTALSPLHALGRHTASLAIAHPISYAKGARSGAFTFRDFLKSPTEGRAAMQATIDKYRSNLALNSEPRPQLFGHPDFAQAPTGAARLEIRNPHGGGRTGEDFVPSQLLGKIPGIGRAVEGAQAAFSMTQNTARYEALKGSMNFSAKLVGRRLTEAEKGGLADRINHYTARGFRTESDLAKRVGMVANVPLYSPQLQSSYARMAADLVHAAAHPKRVESLETLRLAGGTVGRVAVYAGVAKALGLSVDLDPQSSNFLKIDLGPKDGVRGALSAIGSQLGDGVIAEDNGHVFLDMTHSMAGYVKAIAQTAALAQKDHTFRFDIGIEPQYDSKNIGAPVGNLIANHLGPGFYDLNRLRLGEQVKPLNAAAPIAVTGAAEAAGWEAPSVQLAGGHLFKGQAPADLQIGPGPTAKPTKTSAPAKTAAPVFKTRPTR